MSAGAKSLPEDDDARGWTADDRATDECRTAQVTGADAGGRRDALIGVAGLLQPTHPFSHKEPHGWLINFVPEDPCCRPVGRRRRDGAVACGASGGTIDPSATPGPVASPAPSVGPSAPSSPVPTSAPTRHPAAGPITVDLEDPTGHDVSVVIADEAGTLLDARSGTPGDGMSVRWFDSKVENIDAETLRVVWVGLPRDEELALTISVDGGQYRLGLVQAAPPANSDALGVDRVLELRFDALCPPAMSTSRPRRAARPTDRATTEPSSHDPPDPGGRAVSSGGRCHHRGVRSAPDVPR